jgi:hypothetical protein
MGQILLNLLVVLVIDMFSKILDLILKKIKVAAPQRSAETGELAFEKALPDFGQVGHESGLELVVLQRNGEDPFESQPN